MARIVTEQKARIANPRQRLKKQWKLFVENEKDEDLGNPAFYQNIDTFSYIDYLQQAKLLSESECANIKP